jgi:hypothetical protein
MPAQKPIANTATIPDRNIADSLPIIRSTITKPGHSSKRKSGFPGLGKTSGCDSSPLGQTSFKP